MNPAGTPVWRRDYHYSAEGDLVAVDESERGRTRYRHDAAHQLSEVHHPDGRVDAYRYDEAANLIGAPHLGRVAVGPGNKLLVANGGDITYDERDHMATWERGSQALRFHHDALEQLRRIDGLSAPWSAEYDPLGRRISKTFGGETTTYYWDTDRLAAEISPRGALRLYVYTDDFALTPWLVIDYDGVDADPASGRVHTLVSDQRGAPVLALDADGEVAWSASIAPYGLASTEGELQIHHRLAGQILDPETGLHYHRFRYYSPELGRYLESDPSGTSGGINLYAYTYNPLAQFDPQGLRCGDHEGDDCGCPEHGATRPSDTEPGKDGPSPYPPRTREAQAECQRVVEVIDAMGVSPDNRRVVSVFTHEDGTVSVGFSGRDSHKFETLAKQIESELNRRIRPPRYRVARETMPRAGLDEKKGGNRKGECAEPHAAHAAHESESPITGMDTRWRGPGDNPHPYGGENADGAPVHPSQMKPCNTCGDPKNARAYMEHANG